MVFLVYEVPRDSQSQHEAIEWIVGHEEGHPAPRGVVDVCCHHVKACSSEMKVRVDIDDGVVSHFDALCLVLDGVLAKHWTVGRSVVLREISHVGSYFGAKNTGDSEL